MSLINEALKKAQRQHAESASRPDGTPSIAKRAAPRSATSMVLIALGVLVLVVIAIAATAWWVTRPVTRPTTEIAQAKPALTAPAAESPAPLVVPAITLPVAEKATAAKPSKPAVTAAHGSNAGAASGAGGAPTATDTPVIADSTPPPVPEVKPAAAAPQPDARIRQFVDAVRVTGIRSSGADSKVLMNDRVYRVNQVVNPELGVRLTKVSSDSLTFTDRNGIAYVKYF